MRHPSQKLSITFEQQRCSPENLLNLFWRIASNIIVSGFFYVGIILYLVHISRNNVHHDMTNGRWMSAVKNKYLTLCGGRASSGKAWNNSFKGPGFISLPELAFLFLPLLKINTS